MSKYKRIEVSFKSRESLIEALKACGSPFETAAAENGLGLYGYHGDLRPERATFVVRREYVESAANDIGFAYNAQTGYEAIISEFDSGQHRRGTAILNRIKQGYAENEVIRQARLRGYSVNRVKAEGGAVRLQLVRR